MFYPEKYRVPIDKKHLLWLGKEVEYRSCQPLRFSRKVFRGRIIKICPCRYAIVEVHYESSFSVKIYGKEYQFKKSYLKNSAKLPWKEIKSELHLIKLSKSSRWKMIEFDRSFL